MSDLEHRPLHDREATHSPTSSSSSFVVAIVPERQWSERRRGGLMSPWTGIWGTATTRTAGSEGGLKRLGGWRVVGFYLVDWLVTIVLWVAFYAVDNAHGFWREFDLNDASIQHSFTVHETVPVYALALIALACALLIALCAAFNTRSWWDLHNGLLGLVLSLALTTAVTDVIKITAGRPRPDLLARCNPIPGAMNRTPEQGYGLTTAILSCTTFSTSDGFSKLRDGFRSFPSGHASTAFASLGYLTFFIMGKFGILRKRRGSTIKTWIAFVPLLGASLVAISRTMDYRHHWGDVLVGSILGEAFAYFAYRQYYPALSGTDSASPKIPLVKPEVGHRGAAQHESVSVSNDYVNDLEQGRAHLERPVRMGRLPSQDLETSHLRSESRVNGDENGFTPVHEVPSLSKSYRGR